MLSFILRRFLSSLVVLFCAMSATLLLSFMMKGGPFDKEKAPPAHVREAQLKRYKLQGTAWDKYSAYIADLARGDLRVSFRYKDWTVREVLAQKLPTSFVLGGLAFLIASIGGVTLGSLAALKRDSLTDVSAMIGALFAISIPTFVTGPFAVAIFGLWLNLVPVGGWGSWQQAVLPAICLAAPFMAYVARLMRNSLLEVLKSDYLRTARAKGLDPTQSLVRHALKVGIMPVVTYLGPMAAYVLTGSFVVESVFNIPGAGSVFVNSIQNRDVFLLVGAVAVYCVLLIVFNFVVDVVRCALDKRIKIYG
jgi:oligopeptide transport system permease protein